MEKVELVIVGAGPAGLAAAIEAAKFGVKATLIDDNSKAGGQIYRQYNRGIHITDPNLSGRDSGRGKKLLEEFSAYKDRVEYLNDSLVWGLFDQRELAFQQGRNSRSLSYQRLILATGAYDRPVPFPGWTLPGVLTAGGAQNLVKMQGVLPGEKILLAGTGPLQLVLGSQIIKAEGCIEAILEAGHINRWPSLVRGFWGQWRLLSDGWHYWRTIHKAGVPLKRGHIILKALGDNQVEAAVVAEVDDNWRVIPGTQQTLEVDAICLGYGFVPSVELTRLAKCDHRYERQLGGWIPARRKNMETSVPGVYSVGDGSGVAGSLVALEEGRIAGISVAESLGCISPIDAQKRVEIFQNRLRTLNRVRAVLDEISRPRKGLYELARDDTIICRCEEITLGDIREAMVGGATDINEIKRMTRMGMGRCQGRMCGPAMLEIITGQQCQDVSPTSFLNPRPPVKPVPLGVLAKHSEAK